MTNQKGIVSPLLLSIIFVVVVVIVGGLIYLDSTGKLSGLIKGSQESQGVTGEPVSEDTGDQQVQFVPYQSPDQLYQIQIPDFWLGEERAGAAIFYSYDPAQGEPEQRAKIEITKTANPDNLTAAEWLEDVGVDNATAQQATFGNIRGLMLLQDNTDDKVGDIKSVIYMPVNEQMVIVTSESFGGTRDMAVQFFNAILNSWQWVGEVTSPSLVAAEQDDQAGQISDEVGGQDADETANNRE